MQINFGTVGARVPLFGPPGISGASRGHLCDSSDFLLRERSCPRTIHCCSVTACSLHALHSVTVLVMLYRQCSQHTIWKVLRVLITHPATFPEISNGLLSRSILRICVQKLKFAALPVPEIIAGPQKIWAVPGYAHAPFFPKILKGFCSHRPCEYTRQVWSS